MYGIELDSAASDSVLLHVLYYDGEEQYGSPNLRWVHIDADLLFEPEMELGCD
jgi:hypothetical protein